MAVTIIIIFGVLFAPLTAMPRKPCRAVVINRMKGDLALIVYTWLRPYTSHPKAAAIIRVVAGNAAQMTAKNASQK